MPVDLPTSQRVEASSSSGGHVLPFDLERLRAGSDATERAWPTLGRSVSEFLVLLLIGILFTRTFAAEAYIVPTGSMAPTLLGLHRDLTCPSCGLRFALGVDENGPESRPVCPNCGQGTWPIEPGVLSSGDRLLVQKYLFDLRPPRRWESVVFQNPSQSPQAYVKRVVGLPGESVLIRGGNVWIDGKIARKGDAERRALRLLVYDHDHPPADIARYPRFVLHRGGRRVRTPSGWQVEGTAFVRPAEPEGASSALGDWIDYRHWQADRADYGPIRDFNPYNGADLPGEYRVDDLMLQADVKLGPGVRGLLVRIASAGDRFMVSLPVDGLGPLEVRRNGRLIPVRPTGVGLSARGGAAVRLDVALVDQRLEIQLDGRPVFDPYDYDEATPRYGSGNSPVGIGIEGPGEARVSGLKIWRDIYYTDALAGSPHRPFGVGEPYKLGPGEYFVLGDNSPVSNDSRFWTNSPVVRREALVGKPFLVHLPSQAVPLQVFGRERYWIPDPRAIRYIR